MNFVDRVPAQGMAGKKRLIKVDVNNVPTGEPDIYVNIERDDGPPNVAGTLINAANLNAITTDIISELNNFKAGADYVVDSGTGSVTINGLNNSAWNGKTMNTWWRKYKSGWIEQGGYWNSGVHNIGDMRDFSLTFPKPFTDLNFYSVVSAFKNNSAWQNRDGRGNIYSRNQTGMKIGTFGADSSGLTWYAAGKG
ncbi:MAG: hypothetical protein LBN07_05250 [Christensenellaceae bacterium]|jgi:hypothetical protein|nr:hypothetical protein [Christensenellaceae bacterium]